jgi:hypothetical protein
VRVPGSNYGMATLILVGRECFEFMRGAQHSLLISRHLRLPACWKYSRAINCGYLISRIVVLTENVLRSIPMCAAAGN